LTEVCWNKLIENYPAIMKTEKNKLIDAGIPFEFLQRIPSI